MKYKPFAVISKDLEDFNDFITRFRGNIDFAYIGVNLEVERVKGIEYAGVFFTEASQYTINFPTILDAVRPRIR